jgi:hypothetical protein
VSSMDRYLGSVAFATLLVLGSSVSLSAQLRPDRPVPASPTFGTASCTGAECASQRSYWVTGAAVGLVVGAAGTWVFLHQGGSTSLCDRDRNQDAIRANECLALAAAGGVVGAVIGGLIGSRIRTSAMRYAPIEALRIGATPRDGVHLRLNMAF